MTKPYKCDVCGHETLDRDSMTLVWWTGPNVSRFLCLVHDGGKCFEQYERHAWTNLDRREWLLMSRSLSQNGSNVFDDYTWHEDDREVVNALRERTAP